jgi:hypothetical protein
MASAEPNTRWHLDDLPICSGAPGGFTDRSQDAARYIAGLTAELASMARAAELDLVAYLLDIARMEAARAGCGLTPDAL